MDRKSIMILLHAAENTSTCLSRHVGAILVDNNNSILGIGCNRAPSKCRQCSEIGYCLRKKLGAKSGEMLDVCRAVHAEENALLDAVRYNNIPFDKPMTMYVSNTPCDRCAKLLIEFGVTKIVALNDYNCKHTKDLFDEANVDLEIVGDVK